MTLVLFDLRDDLGVSAEALEELIKQTSLYALSIEWKWIPRSHFKDIVVNIPDPPLGEIHDS